MDRELLYKQIADSIRSQVLKGTFKPGDRLPSVRDLTAEWDCTVGTAQHAYKQLSNEGLVVSRPGRGTVVASGTRVGEKAPLRIARLAHRADAFLLDAIALGYSAAEINQSLHIALDRWNSVANPPAAEQTTILRFVGSHDMAMSYVASHFPTLAPGHQLDVSFTGSLGGLMALAKGEADLAGCHLWDEETDSYNVPFVARMLPHRRAFLITLAERKLGLAVLPGNPKKIGGLVDLGRSGVRFVNRQIGAGTRVWLDANLQALGLHSEQIEGYEHQVSTHFEVAMDVAEDKADVGLTIQTAAYDFGLEFIPLTNERYELVGLATIFDSTPIEKLVKWLETKAARDGIAGLGGYDVRHTGALRWVM